MHAASNTVDDTEAVYNVLLHHYTNLCATFEHRQYSIYLTNIYLDW